jgi:hypothetical protein
MFLVSFFLFFFKYYFIESRGQVVSHRTSHPTHYRYPNLCAWYRKSTQLVVTIATELSIFRGNPQARTPIVAARKLLRAKILRWPQHICHSPKDFVFFLARTKKPRHWQTNDEEKKNLDVCWRQFSNPAGDGGGWTIVAKNISSMPITRPTCCLVPNPPFRHETIDRHCRFQFPSSSM